MENNIPLETRLLESTLAASLGTLELSRTLHIGPARTIALVRRLCDEGLVAVSHRRGPRAGRPSSEVTPTQLGLEYLRAYRSLESKRLRSRPADLRKAAADGEYARRLAERKAPVYELFFELSGYGNALRGSRR